jgi:hypothetical protein
VNAVASASVEGVMRLRLPFFLFAPAVLAFVPATASAQATGFDRMAAATALTRDFDPCLPDDTPVYVVVTFAPSGAIESIADPTWGSTPKTLKTPKVGPVPDSVLSCVRNLLSGARIPAFTGEPVRVRKKIDISDRVGCAELVVASSYRWSPVLVDGRRVGTTLLQTRLTDGEHELTWQRADGSVGQRKYTFKCGHRLTLMLYADRDPKVFERRVLL